MQIRQSSVTAYAPSVRTGVRTRCSDAAGFGTGAVEASNGTITAAQPASAGTLDRVRTQGKLVLGYYTMSNRCRTGPVRQSAGYAVTLCRQVADEVKSELGVSQLAVEWIALTRATACRRCSRGKSTCCAERRCSLKTGRMSPSRCRSSRRISALLRADAPRHCKTYSRNAGAYRPIWRASPFSPIQHKTLTVVAGTSAVDWAKDRASKLRIIGKQDTVDSYETGWRRWSRRLRRALRRPFHLACPGKAQPDASKLRVLTRHYTYEPLAWHWRATMTISALSSIVLDRFYASPKFGETYASVFGRRTWTPSNTSGGLPQ